MSLDHSSIGGDNFAVIAPRITGGISALSSGLIIASILRSPTKLNTIYHRIMFGMSCADILFSIAVGLTSLPMPRDMKYLVGPDNDFGVGTRLGNVQTCEAQGFFFVFGMTSMFAYNGSLWIYYTCAIAFQMNEEIIAKYIEPLFHIVPLSIGLGAASPPLVYGLYHPTYWDAWCTISANAKINNTANKDLVQIITISLLLMIIIICFVLILWRVFQTERRLYGPNRIIRRSQMLDVARVEGSHRNTKILLYQALAYFLSYAVSLSPMSVRAVMNEPLWVIRSSFVLVPFQGFFNALIFIYHKVVNYRRAHNDVSRWSVLVLLAKGSVEDPLLFSRISVLKIDEGRRKVEIELADERIVEPLGEFDLDVPPPPSRNGGLAYAGVSIDSRGNLSGFSKSHEGAEGGKEKTDNSKGGLSGFSSILSPELESQFVEDRSIVPSVREDEALSYSKGWSVFSSLEGIWSSDASRGNP